MAAIAIIEIKQMKKTKAIGNQTVIEILSLSVYLMMVFPR